jgi:hypothetical protein
VNSHGCVRVAGCGCAKEVHDNTASGVTSVCVHDGRHCNRPQPGAGAIDAAHQSVCGQLHVALPPAPTRRQQPSRPPRGHQRPADSPPRRNRPGRMPNAEVDLARVNDLVAANDVDREDEEMEL